MSDRNTMSRTQGLQTTSTRKMMPSDSRSPRLGLWLLLLGCLFVIAPTTYPGYWQAQEGFVPVFNAPHSSVVAGIATLPDLWRGIGRGAFLLAQPLMLLGATPVLAVRFTFAIAMLLGGLGVYVWLQPRLGERAAGLAGLVYLLMPPLLAAIYVRGNVADVLVMGLLPLALAGIAAYAEGRSLVAAAVVVLSVLWMWRIQAGLALFATVLLIAYTLFVERSRLAVLVAVVSGAAGLVSLVPIWSIRAPSPVVFADHFVSVTQWLASGAFSTNSTVAQSPTLWQNEPFQLGFAAVGLSVVAWWLWSRDVNHQRSTLLRRLIYFSGVSVVVILLLTLSFSAPLWSWSRADQLLTYPWQLMLLTTPLFAVMAGSVPALNAYLQRTPLWLALVGMVILSSYPYLHAHFTRFEPPSAPVASFGRNPDLILLEAKLQEDVDPVVLADDAGENGGASSERSVVRNPNSVYVRLDVTWQVLQPLSFDYNVFFQAVNETDQGWDVIAQLDTQPRQGLDPATSWGVGQIMTDTYQLELPAPLPEGKIHYLYGYYDWRDGTRLPVDGGIDDKLILYGE